MTNYRRHRKSNHNTTNKWYKINQRITANEVTLIDEEGKMVGVVSFQEASKIAHQKDMDLIEINPKANPPIVKIMSYSKFKYQQSKNDSKKNKVSKIKTIRVSIRIATHDLDVQVYKVKEFLIKGQKVKLEVKMRGRERSHPEQATKVMNDFLQRIGTVTDQGYDFEAQPKLEGDNVSSIIKANKVSKQTVTNKPKNEINNEEETNLEE
jgi:translation initiation factor IF-3